MPREPSPPRSSTVLGGAMTRNRWRLVVVAGVLVAFVWVALELRSQFAADVDVAVQASSSASGTDPYQLLTVAATVGEPRQTTVPAIDEGAPDDGATWHEGDVTWRSTEPAKGTWLSFTWPTARQISHIRIDGAGGAEHAYTAAVVRFDDGANVWVTPDAQGNVSADMTPREVQSATIQFVSAPEGNEAIALRAVAFDDSGSDVSFVDGIATASGDANPAAALTDGDIANASLGDEWSPLSGDGPAWAGFAWEREVELASVQIAGLAGAAPTVRGTLHFSDGSSVVVSGVTSGAVPVTTIGFTPRTVSWMRFELDSDRTGISELRPYPPGVTPPQWPTSDGLTADPLPLEPCDETTPPIGTAPDSELALVCPATGTSVGDVATIVIAAPPGDALTATAMSAVDQHTNTVGTARANDDGIATMAVDMADLQHGPVAILVTGESSEYPLYVQLFNQGGTVAESTGYAPAGMTLQYRDEFTQPLSITHYGEGATYAATKPAGEGGSEFSDAVFADPAWGTGTFSTLDGEYLRIRLQDLGDRDDPWGWERDYLGGLLSSARVGGSGFSAQYGYFEARILAPAGRGSWPALWMLDTESAVAPEDGTGEVDAVELYGHNPVGTCHTVHNHPGLDGAPPPPVTEQSCFEDSGIGDWALTWHTYGAHIRPNGADMYIDGELIASWEGLARDDTPYYFLINLMAGGGWPVDLNATGEDIEMYVDWVHVYS